MPRLIYGTAWKGSRTEDLVYAALRAGFQAVDTAADPRHYDEAAVGRAIRRAVADGLVRREQLFIQTKLTVDLPDREGKNGSSSNEVSSLTIQEQVNASVRTSLARLGSPIDCLLLHRVPRGRGRARAAWRALEDWVLQPSLSPLSPEGPEPESGPGYVRRLGVSGISLLVFESLFPAHDDESGSSSSSSDNGSDNGSEGGSPGGAGGGIRVPPAVVQNAFHRRAAHFEDDLRRALRRRGVAFQAYHVLTGNRQEFELPLERARHHNNTDSRERKKNSNNGNSGDSASAAAAAATAVHDLARRAGVSPAAAAYALVLGLGGTAVLDGTAREARMAQDVRELAAVAALAGDDEEGGRAVWEECARQLAQVVNMEGEGRG